MPSMTVSATITLEAPQRIERIQELASVRREAGSGSRVREESVSAVLTAGKWSVAEEDRVIGPLAKGDRMIRQFWNLG